MLNKNIVEKISFISENINSISIEGFPIYSNKFPDAFFEQSVKLQFDIGKYIYDTYNLNATHYIMFDDWFCEENSQVVQKIMSLYSNYSMCNKHPINLKILKESFLAKSLAKEKKCNNLAALSCADIDAYFQAKKKEDVNILLHPKTFKIQQQQMYEKLKNKYSGNKVYTFFVTGKLSFSNVFYNN